MTRHALVAFVPNEFPRGGCRLRSYIIEQARLLRQKTENRYLAVLVAAWGVNRCRKALFGVASRPDTPTAVLGGETVEH